MDGPALESSPRRLVLWITGWPTSSAIGVEPGRAAGEFEVARLVRHDYETADRYVCGAEDATSKAGPAFGWLGNSAIMLGVKSKMAVVKLFAGFLMLAGTSYQEKASLTIQFVDGQTTFHVGEVIPIELSFSASVPGTYEMTTANYDRSGRLNIEQFHVAPEGRDPLHNYYAEGGFFGGGLRSSRVLSAKPETMREELNEWVALDKPGHYTLTVTSGRVSRMGGATPNESAVTMESNTLEFDIVEADPAWQAGRLSSAVLVLDDDHSKAEQKAAALRQLRFLDTPASVHELVRQLARHAATGCWDCVAGLAGSVHQDLAVQTLAQEMRAPDVAINQQYLHLLMKLKTQLDHGVPPPYPEKDEKQQQLWQQNMEARNKQMLQLEETLYEQAAALVPSKQGAARAETVHTLLLRPTHGPGYDGLTSLPGEEVASAFSALSEEEQWTLLSVFWERIKVSAMTGPLQKLTGQAVIRHQVLRDVALQRLYELDRQAGRARILEEITHPHVDGNSFAVKGKTLGLLPDETLPQFDELLAGRLENKNNRTMDLDAQLIGRYASKAILPRVQAVYETAAGRWDCAIEDGLVLYFLRTQPDYGVQRLATSAASICLENSLPAVIRMNRWSEVEPSVIAGLQQADLNRARQAAETLARYGSAKAKAAIWARVRSFHEQWAGRDSALVFRANMSREESEAMGFEFGLVEALGRARAWLLSDEEVTELEKLTVGPEKENVSQWHRKSPIAVDISGWLDGHVQASIQQYGVQDLESLRQKLAQYESGTRFIVSATGNDEQVREAMRTVREVAAERALVVEIAGEQ